MFLLSKDATTNCPAKMHQISDYGLPGCCRKERSTTNAQKVIVKARLAFRTNAARPADDKDQLGGSLSGAPRRASLGRSFRPPLHGLRLSRRCEPPQATTHRSAARERPNRRGPGAQERRSAVRLPIRQRGDERPVVGQARRERGA
jgi:hypothetical protein